MTALRFSPRGDVLAVARRGALTLWRTGNPAITSELPVAELPIAGSSLAMAWSPGGTKLAFALETGGVGVWQREADGVVTLSRYPSPVKSIAWSADGEALVTSGAFRIIAWPRAGLTPGGAPSTLETGKPSLVAIEAIAIHPRQALVAAGYESGMVIVATLGKPDELLIKREGGGAVTGLRWSGSGRHLAFGSDRGTAAIVELPPHLFK